jgi:hypothetical protein
MYETGDMIETEGTKRNNKKKQSFLETTYEVSNYINGVVGVEKTAMSKGKCDEDEYP